MLLARTHHPRISSMQLKAPGFLVVGHAFNTGFSYGGTCLPRGVLTPRGTRNKIVTMRSGRARDGIADGEYSRHRNRRPSHVGLAAAVCGTYFFFVHASTDMYDESCARRLYEARIHGRGLPAWYGGVALKAPQKRRGGSACECRPEKVSLRRVYWGHAGPTAWRGHHGSPHA